MFTAIVPIRDGSKGLPSKNIRPLGGKRLYRHAVDQAISLGARRVIVSTDIQKVLNETHPLKMQLLPRPTELCSDSATMTSVIIHAIETCKINGKVMLLQATSPLRRKESLQNALSLFNEGSWDLIMGVKQEDPSVLKCGTLDGIKFEPVKDVRYPFSNRQDLPEVVKPNGAVYVFDASWFIENRGFVSDKIGVVKMNTEDSADIDTLSDFEYCERVLEKRRKALIDENF